MELFEFLIFKHLLLFAETKQPCQFQILGSRAQAHALSLYGAVRVPVSAVVSPGGHQKGRRFPYLVKQIRWQSRHWRDRPANFFFSYLSWKRVFCRHRT